MVLPRKGPDQVKKDGHQALLNLAHQLNPMKVGVNDSLRELNRRRSLTGEHISISIANGMKGG